MTRAKLQAVVNDAGEQTVVETADGAVVKPRRPRGPNKPKAAAPGDFLGGLRQLAAQHRAKLATLTEQRDVLRGKLDAVNRELDGLEAPIRDVERLLAGHPELALGAGPGQPPATPTEPGRPAPEQPAGDPPPHQPAPEPAEVPVEPEGAAAGV